MITADLLLFVDDHFQTGVGCCGAATLVVHILVGVSHLAGEPERGNGLLVVFRAYIKLAAQHVDDGLADGHTGVFIPYLYLFVSVSQRSMFCLIDDAKLRWLSSPFQLFLCYSPRVVMTPARFA